MATGTVGTITRTSFQLFHNIFFCVPPHQLTANCLVFAAANLVGLFVHNLMEHAQRRAFLVKKWIEN